MNGRFWIAGLMGIAMASTAIAQAPANASGKVTKVDVSAGKITIDHGPIKSLDMPAMTMVFRAGDDAMLKAVKPGDNVKFVADKINGQFTVTKIEKAR